MGSFSAPLPSLSWNFCFLLSQLLIIGLDLFSQASLTQSHISYSFRKTRQRKSITHNALQHNKWSIVGEHQYGVIEYCLSEYVIVRWLHNLLSYLNDRDSLREQRAKSCSLKLHCGQREWHLMTVLEWRDRDIRSGNSVIRQPEAHCDGYTHTYNEKLNEWFTQKF